ncbi:hypothetical protein [Actinophytocola xinjiangensis]|uniref:hypothetical protein n=1 Tax=Actinophytocola xinjiangensis TaxID=485602 RepID=UPI0012B7191E|nr:hypothetical protein [Actinophytocola xinjiangensis]
MSTDTLTGSARTMTVWAGGLFAVVSAMHLLFFVGGSLDHLPDWVPGGPLWTSLSPGDTMGQPLAWFWLSVGSFAVPTLLLGLVLAGSARQGRALPGYVTWTLAVWTVVAALMVLPSGLPVLVVASGLLVAARLRR